MLGSFLAKIYVDVGSVDLGMELFTMRQRNPKFVDVALLNMLSKTLTMHH